jgi:ketosteroid isomerase-like protein
MSPDFALTKQERRKEYPMEDVQSIIAANQAFYRAFETLEIKEMEKVWLRASHIKCVHPGWSLLCGWGPIMTSWERIFDNTFSMRFTLTDVRVEVSGSLAWVVLIENLESHGYDGPSRSQVLTTNIFEQQDGHWFIVHHHASPIFAPPATGEDQLQ